jgi:hypothetical protein
MSKPQSRAAATKSTKIAVKPGARTVTHSTRSVAVQSQVADLDLSALLGPQAPATPAPPHDPHAIPEMSMEMSARAFREDPGFDRRIIEGMLEDKDIFLEKMHRRGYAKDAVLRRAAELGLSEALIRQVKGVAADLAGERPGRRPAPSSLGARTCLSCDRIFLSSGPGNRLCMRCRGGDAGLAQL